MNRKKALKLFEVAKEQQRIDDEIASFKRQWLRSFAGDIPQAQIDRYVFGCGPVLWHVFSWKLLPESAYLTGDAARKAYDSANKTDALVWEPFEDHGVTSFSPEADRTAEKLEQRVEVFVMEKRGKWTYVKTHEPDCGPYYYQPET